MRIVGVGCSPGFLTVRASAIIREADEVWGSARAIALAVDELRPGCPVHEIEDYRGLRELPRGAVVLSTGDPMLSGLGYLPGEVEPGVSSLQLALARLRIPWTRVAVLTAHGRNHDEAVTAAADEVGRGRVVFLIADPAFPVQALADALSLLGDDIRIAICENLGYPGERIACGTVAAPPEPSSALFVVLAGRF
ncbi:MAG: cobalt-precorrin-7 (C(5))-methyltransferase [Methanospirillum sp.]